ncbi:MAG: IclR family transcriptional regulator [Novosphingobium sp.]|nr:IclR family transcriptional regulator [Novosphingobium sp.]
MSKIVDRTLDFFELFAEQKRTLSLSEIAKLLDIPVSSCHDVLQALIRRGYVYELASRAGYYPTSRLYTLAEAIVDHDPLLLRAELAMDALAAKVGETVALAKASDLEMSYVMVKESNHQLRFSVRVGDGVRSLYATSAGKALLGSLDGKARDAVIARLKLEQFTPMTIVDRDALRNDIAVGVERGWYLNDEESALDAMTLSASFRWRNVLYVLTVAGPKSRVSSKREEIIDSLLETCRQLSA